MNYDEVSRRISLLEGAFVVGHVGSEVGQYPLYCIKRGGGKKVFLSGGIHGDEPAGMYAILTFFEKYAHQYEHRFAFTAFPCLNPWGLQLNTRSNAQNQNLNREFKDNTSAKEIQLILPLLETYIFAMDFHETALDFVRIDDSEPKGKTPDTFHLWEVCENKRLRVGRKIVENIEKAGFPVCKWPTIYGDKNNGGVIWYPEGCGTPCYLEGTACDSFLVNRHHTSQSFTIETPSGWKLKRRVAAHLISLKTVLREKRY